MRDEVFRAILRNVKPHVRRLLLFLFHTGARPSEAAALRWSCIEWEKRIAVLKEHKTSKKTGKPRVLFLSPVIVRLLRWIERNRRESLCTYWLAGILKKGEIKAHDLMKLARAKGYTIRMVYRAREYIVAVKERKLVTNTDSTRHKTRLRYVYKLEGEPRLPRVDDPNDFVFVTLKQTSWKRQAIATIIYRLYRDGVLSPDDHRRVYGLRHRAITELCKRGKNLKAVAVYAGHVLISTTMHYLTSIDDDTDFIHGEIFGDE